MALFTDWATKLTAFLTQNVGATAIILTKSDGSPDLQQSGGNGDALVSLSTASTAALASQTTLASVLAQLVTILSRLDQPTKHTAVTPSDTTDVTLTASKGLLIGGSGNLYYTLVSAVDTEVGPLAVQPGQFVPGQFAKVKTKGGLTTATGIMGLS